MSTLQTDNLPRSYLLFLKISLITSFVNISYSRFITYLTSCRLYIRGYSVIFTGEKHTNLKPLAMKKNFTYCLFFLITVSTFYNCSPVSISRVSIQKEDVGYWQKGKAIGEKVSEDLIVEAVYSHSDKKFDYFDIAIENIGEERALIDPKTFRLVDPTSGGILRGVDPELMILNLEMKDSKRQANNKTLAVVAGAAVIAGTVAVIAATDDAGGAGNSSDGGDDYHFYDTYVYTDLTPQGNVVPMNYQYFSQEPLLSSDTRTLPDAKKVEFWKGYTFRKSTLFQNQRMRGLVGFLRDKNRSRSTLIIPTSSQEVSFDFIHEEHRP